MRRATELLCIAAIASMLAACSTIDNIPWWPPQERSEITGTTPGPVESTADDHADDIVIHGAIDAVSPPDDGIDELLGQGHWYLTLSPEDQRREFSRAEARYLDDPAEINLIRLGLYATLTQPERPGAHPRVRKDLHAWLTAQNAENDENDLYPLAGLVLHLLDDRERLMAQLTSQNEELQHKLDELKAIEQQLRERDSTDIIRTLP